VSVKIAAEVTRVPPSPLRPDIMRTITRVTDSLWPGVAVIPTMVPGATDGRYLRAAGIPTYGVQGLFVDQSDIRMHGRDERMSVKSFYEGETFLYQLVKMLSKSGE
jgi:acetylornithine deacetylase/succinyl-diaminopimelate desuccinylase-like protein